MNVIVDKQAIIDSFSQKASTYEQHANVQQRNAELLTDFIEAEMDFADGPVLEIGCGTGIFTRKIVNLFPDRHLFVSDISNAMLQQCAENIAHHATSSTVEFVQLDAEAMRVETKFALIIASFSLQWVSDFERTIQNLLEHLLPDGQLILAVPTNRSFKEWRTQCVRSNIPCTANELPDPNRFLDRVGSLGLSIESTVTDIECEFESSLDFFKSLKGVGASVSTTGGALNGAQLRKLTREWDECSTTVSVTYSVLSARIRMGGIE
ncbi:MAG TPA: methyltransferase domain-containing protein [Drouetiella sp.]